MATIREVTMGRPGHYRHWPISMLEAARCECGAEWHQADHPDETFCGWAMNHQTPGAPIAAAVNWAQRRSVCRGSNEMVHETSTRDRIGLCPICKQWKLTSPALGYGGWRTIDAHPASPGAA